MMWLDIMVQSWGYLLAVFVVWIAVEMPGHPGDEDH